MSTYYINKLQIEGEASAVELAKASIRGFGEDGNVCDIDFNKIVPEPIFEPVELDQDIRDCLQTLAEPCIRANPPTLNDKQFDTLVTGLRNYRKTGFFASSFWRIANWGTPWNATSHSAKGKDVDAIYFITKNFTPVNAIEQLSRMLGDVSLTYTYYPESLDEIGQVKITNGVVTCSILPSDEATPEAVTLFEEF